MTEAHAVVIGAGPAGLMAAEHLAMSGLRVSVFEKMPSPGRKLLMAGRGGLNLTHSEPLDRLMDRYGTQRPRLEPAIRAFTPDALIGWAQSLGQETFVGSSLRVFPKAMKASPLLRAWLERLGSAGVSLATRHAWTGFSDHGVWFDTPQGPREIRADVVVLALGGASWPRLGADGGWTTILRDCAISPLRPANCGFVVDWSAHLRALGRLPLKRITAMAGPLTARGEAMITPEGIEGGAIYALSGALREAIAADGMALLTLDLRPDLTLDALEARLGQSQRGLSLANFLRKSAGLAPSAIALVNEIRHQATPDPESANRSLAALIKRLPLRLRAPFPLDRAISTAGGVCWSDVDEHLMLTRHPGVFVAGEMLDWEAPTGGYLLQACMATGVAAARGAARWLPLRDDRPEAAHLSRS